MSATYDTNLTREIDWVRFLVGDTVLAEAMLQDEEIQGLLDGQIATGTSRRYYAAAEALATLHTRWMSQGRGKASEKVSRLQVVYGTGSGINIDLAIQARISELRKIGARRLSAAPYSFRTI